MRTILNEFIEIEKQTEIDDTETSGPKRKRHEIENYYVLKQQHK